MNTTTNTELAEVASTGQTALDAMAVVTLSPEKYAAEVYQPFKARLVEAIDSVKAIDYDIKTTAGMAVAIKARATFRDLRIDADKERKTRKEPITKIGKLLEAGFDRVEERIAPLEELFDADIKAEEVRKEAEKAAKIAAERARVESIQADIDRLRAIPGNLIGKSAADLAFARKDMLAMVVDEARFAEFTETAKTVVADIIARIELMLTSETEREAAALAAEQARLAEIARIEAERAELAQLRAAAAETARLAKIETDRIAAEQAVEHKRLAEQQAEIEAQRAAFAREQEEARARIEAAAQLERDHAEALPMNVQFDVDREAERVRLQGLADQAAADARERADDERKAGMPAGSLRALMDSDPDELDPTDEEITAMGAECGLTLEAWADRLELFVAWARESKMKAAA